MGNDVGLQVKVIDEQDEMGDGKSEETKGKELEEDELCGLQWWG